MSDEPSGPRLGERLLDAVLPREHAELVFDLRELYLHRARTRGVARARLWYWRQVAGCVWRFCVPSARGARSGTLAHDVRLGMRRLVSSRGLTVVALVSLALGIGANTAVWTVSYQVLLRPLGYAEEERLVRVWPEHQFTRARFETFRAESRSFALFSGYIRRGFTLTGSGSPDVVRGLEVSSEHFDVFGVRPLVGRSFTADDEVPGAETVVIVSEAMWRDRFGGDPDVLGRRIALDETRTVVGVAPRGFRPLGTYEDVWVPLTLDPDDESYTHMANVGVVARLTPDASSESARAELRTMADALDPPLYSVEAIPTYTVPPFHDALVRNVRMALTLLFGASSLVLLLCCVNVTNLLLAKGVGRQHELAVRRAIGASRFRLFRQFLTESAVLGLGAGVIGFVIVWLASPALAGLVSSRLPRSDELAIDLSVAVWTLAISLAASVLFGVIPALRASQPPAGVPSHRSTQSKAHTRVGRGLVAAEIALAVTLVAASGLLLKSFWRLQQVDVGFRPENIVTMRVSPSPLAYEETASKLGYYRELAGALRALPGVTHVGAIQILPMTAQSMGVGYSPTGQPVGPNESPPMTSYRIVSTGYREALGIPLLAGRDLDEADRPGTEPVGLINASLADELWPNADAVGRTVRYEDGSEWFRVVGVMGDVHQHRLDESPRVEVYVPLAQDSWPSTMQLVVRSVGAPVPPTLLRETIWSVDRNVPVTQVRTMDEVVRAAMTDTTRRTALFSAFAVLAFVLSAVGVYGVTSYAVAQRSREIGIRVALGATRRRVVAETLREALTPVVVGIAAGFAMSALVSRALGQFLFEVETTDSVVYLAVALLLGLTALVSGYVPARRAARSNPVEVLTADI